MTILPEFDDVEEVNLLLRLLSEEEASLTGRLVLARRRISEGEDACTARQWERAERAVRALPEQVDRVTDVKDALRSALREARRQGMRV